MYVFAEVLGLGMPMSFAEVPGLGMPMSFAEVPDLGIHMAPEIRDVATQSLDVVPVGAVQVEHDADDDGRGNPLGEFR